MPEGAESRNLTRCLYTNIHCLIIHISQKVETIQMSVNKCMDKQTMVYMVNRILFNHKRNLKRNEVLTHATTLHEPWKHNAKWNKPDVCVSVAQSCPALCNPPDMDSICPWTVTHQTLCSSVHEILQARILERILERVAIPFSRGDPPDPGIEPESLTLQADSLPLKPLGKPPFKPPFKPDTNR